MSKGFYTEKTHRYAETRQSILRKYLRMVEIEQDFLEVSKRAFESLKVLQSMLLSQNPESEVKSWDEGKIVTKLKFDLRFLMNDQKSSIGLSSQWNLGRKRQMWPASSMILFNKGFSFAKSDCRLRIFDQQQSSQGRAACGSCWTSSGIHWSSVRK